MSNELDAPSAFPWPPLLLAGVVGSALAVDRWLMPLPLPFAELTAVRAAGLVILLSSVALLVWAAVEFQRHDTTIRPDRESRALITSGPFAWSRNPIYLAEIVALLGAALVFNKLMLALGAPVFGVLVTALAVRPEEDVLKRKFGLAYEDYCHHVRRWL